MSAPKRIQLRRTKGWRMPANTVRCCRPGPWGNQFRVVEYPDGGAAFGWSVPDIISGRPSLFRSKADAQAYAVERFRDYTAREPAWRQVIRQELAGKDLACCCGLDEPCHADVLLEIANAGGES